MREEIKDKITLNDRLIRINIIFVMLCVRKSKIKLI